MLSMLACMISPWFSPVFQKKLPPPPLLVYVFCPLFPRNLDLKQGISAAEQSILSPARRLLLPFPAHLPFSLLSLCIQKRRSPYPFPFRVFTPPHASRMPRSLGKGPPFFFPPTCFFFLLVLDFPFALRPCSWPGLPSQIFLLSSRPRSFSPLWSTVIFDPVPPPFPFLLFSL